MPLTPFVTFIRNTYQGVFVRMTLVGGVVVTGEVYDGFDNFIALRNMGITTYVNAAFITSIL